MGSVELNPGPDLESCRACGYVAHSIADHMNHQRVHGSSFNFHYMCPVSLCHFTFTSYATLNAHVSTHEVSRNVPSNTAGGYPCGTCGAEQACVSNLCHHAIDSHLKSGEAVLCPLNSNCGVTRLFKTVAQLRPHLSSHHPGWNKDFGRAQNPVIGELVVHQPDELHEDHGGPDTAFEFSGGVSFGGEDWEDCSSSSNDSSDDQDWDGSDIGLSNEVVLDFIAKFYAKLEGKHFVPAATVQKISETMRVLSEILQARLKSNLISNLKEANLTEDQIDSIIHNVTFNDILYNAHHKTDLCESLSSIYLRKAYYRKHFQYVEATEINLKRRNPHDRSATLQYIPLKETLDVMLADPSIQKRVDESFVAVTDPNIKKNYTDGSVFQDRNLPKKRIDLILHQDAFNGVSNALGSAKNKYKTLATYFTLGNLPTHVRSRLKAKRLVLLVFESNTKDENLPNGLKKCFSKLISDLKDLEGSGIDYKGEILPVYFQFLLGDNLGQHTVGGFIESFTTRYFCRFCTITSGKFRADQEQDNPVFRPAKWRTPKHFERALQKKGGNFSYKGIKRQAIFSGFKAFHVCDPGLPSCLAHDMFIGGVVDCDLASILSYFVNDKKWFSYKLLNRRISDFKCTENDTGNKPAKVHKKGKKLGGHAVQNWTLLRLLPLIIADKVDTSHPVWNLYLLLKAISELACAPALTNSQIDTLQVMLDEYMMKRKCLKNKYKPKHHYFHHLADLWKRFGPMIHMWTLGFEQYHQFFKKVARSSNNYINLLFSFADKHQLMQAYQSTGILFPSEATFDCAYPLVPESFKPSLFDFIQQCNFSSDAQVVCKLKFNDVIYKNKQHLLLCIDDLDFIEVGKIKLIVYDAQKYFLILLKCKASLWKEYGIYSISKGQKEFYMLPLNDDLESPCPQAVYEFNGKNCFALKHMLLKV